MKSRITLTIDPGISHRAKEVAMREGVSLSSLVENLLAGVSGTSAPLPREPFSQRWKGKMRLKPNPDERGARLRKKYRIEE